MTEENLRLTLFNRQGLQERLVLNSKNSQV